MVLGNIRQTAFSCLLSRLWPSASNLRHTGWCGRREIFPALPWQETLPWMLLRMNGWLPFKSRGVLFSVFLHPHHTNWQLLVSPLIFSTQDHSTVGIQPFQTAHKLCITPDGIYLLPWLPEDLTWKGGQKTCTTTPQVLLLNYRMPPLT